jgi:hypothetical protein
MSSITTHVTALNIIMSCVKGVGKLIKTVFIPVQQEDATLPLQMSQDVQNVCCSVSVRSEEGVKSCQPTRTSPRKKSPVEIVRLTADKKRKSVETFELSDDDEDSRGNTIPNSMDDGYHDSKPPARGDMLGGRGSGKRVRVSQGGRSTARQGSGGLSRKSESEETCARMETFSIDKELFCMVGKETYSLEDFKKLFHLSQDVMGKRFDEIEKGKDFRKMKNKSDQYGRLLPGGMDVSGCNFL